MTNNDYYRAKCAEKGIKPTIDAYQRFLNKIESLHEELSDEQRQFCAFYDVSRGTMSLRNSET